MAFTFNLSRWSLATLFHYKAKIRGEPVRDVRVSNPYHAVSILPGNRACDAARSCAQVRYLSTEAPVMPLKSCNAPECNCRYQHFKDRRNQPRRSEDGAVVRMHGTWRGLDRRHTGRRIDDE